MNKKPIGLIITIIILGLAAATFVVLFILQTTNSSNLERTVKTQSEEIAALKEKLAKLEETQACSNEKYDVAGIINPLCDNGSIGDHVRGKKDSKIVVVEYADMQCPGCASMMVVAGKLYEKYGDKVAFVFRHYPIEGHDNAKPAAIAAEAAGKQGYFWEMTEELYKNRTDWIYATGSSRTEAFVDIFKSVAPNGDSEQFVEDFSNENIKKKVAFDAKIGKEKSKVSATPSFFVNGEAVDIGGVETLQEYSDRIEKLILEQLK